jgi:hypothetical protein
MSGAQPTPELWKACDLNGNPYVHVDIQQLDPPLVCALYEDVTPVDSVTGWPWLENFPNAAANACLIASAPTMLAALREVVREWDEPYYGDQEERADRMFNVIEKLRPIIAQATGGELR